MKLGLMSQNNKITAEAIRQREPNWQIPNFNSREFFPKKHAYAVCVFVINEGERIRSQLNEMKLFIGTVDIIIADGGSTDGSLQENFLKSVGVRTLLTKTGAGKLSAQMRMAFAYTMLEGYKGVVVVDGNGKDDISAIAAFIDLLEKGYDHIQGSRFIKGGKAVNTPLMRLIAVRFIHAPLISLAAHHRYTDTTNGFRAYSRKLLLDPQISVFRDAFNTYELHYHLAIESARAGRFNIIETPVKREYPKKGKTPTKISPVKGNAHVTNVLINAVRRKYRA